MDDFRLMADAGSRAVFSPVLPDVENTASGIWKGILDCSLEFLEYIVIGACILLVLRALIHFRPYVFRKLLHLVAFTSLLEMLLVAHTWVEASATSLLFAVVVYPVLVLLERFDWYSRLFVQKKRGEVKHSLVELFGIAAVIFALAWGMMDKKYIAAAAILMWGAGDGVAALVGIPYGKHKVAWKYADGKKSWEGTLAMAGTAFLCGLIIFRIYSPFGWVRSILTILPASLLAAAVELVSKKGNDTFTVPISITLLLGLLCL